MAGVVQDYVTGLREVSQTYQEYGDGPSLDPQSTLQANLRDARSDRPDLSPSERLRWAVDESKAEIMHANEQWDAIPDDLKRGAHHAKQQSVQQDQDYYRGLIRNDVQTQLAQDPSKGYDRSFHEAAEGLLRWTSTDPASYKVAQAAIKAESTQYSAQSLHSNFEALKGELAHARSPEERTEIMREMRSVVQQEKSVGGKDASYDESRVVDRSAGIGY